MNTITLTYTETDTERLDSFIARSVDGLSRSAVQRLIEDGEVAVNDLQAKASLKLKNGDTVSVNLPPPVATEAEPEQIPLDILYEDGELIVINKPAGMVVHPGAGNPSGTLVNALLGHCGDLAGIGGELRPGIVHRIDKETSGLLVAAKNDRAHLHLAAQFKAHSIKRIYIALAFGSPKEDKGRIEGGIGRHPTDRKRMSGAARHGKHAVTHWKVIGRFPGITLMQLRLETGRTHQIRVHLAESGHPLVGDPVYGGTDRTANLSDPVLRSLIKKLGRQALHAKTLGFIHPVSGEYMEFDSELPNDMQEIIGYLESQFHS
jgi:23S rRNA pseudouridine1911/1915/1917 synthase